MEDSQNPLVTFALFSYNQEPFIREAIEGAFSQTYQPLEIILSDDGSADRTFDVMQEMAAAYSGPHKVVARRTAQNLGTLLHVADVAGLAQGKLVVLAAGDDVSKAERTAVMVRNWQSSGAWGICSRFDRMSESGEILERSVESGVLAGHRLEDYFDPGEGRVQIIHGCSSAYDARAFQYLHLTTDDYILSEDGVMSVLLNLLGKDILHIDDSLVLYRESPNSLTNDLRSARLTYSDIARDEAKIERLAVSQANRCRLFLRFDDSLGDARVRKLKVDVVTRDLEHQRMRARWNTMAIHERMRGMFAGTGMDPKWALPRLLGLKPFFLAKWMYRRLTGGRHE